MKAATALGCLGCLIWLLTLGFSPESEHIRLALVSISIGLLMVGTIIIGHQKRRIRLGYGMALLSAVFGIGFLIMFVVESRGDESKLATASPSDS